MLWHQGWHRKAVATHQQTFGPRGPVVLAFYDSLSPQFPLRLLSGSAQRLEVTDAMLHSGSELHYSGFFVDSQDIRLISGCQRSCSAQDSVRDFLLQKRGTRDGSIRWSTRIRDPHWEEYSSVNKRHMVTAVAHIQLKPDHSGFDSPGSNSSKLVT
jgi:hypothetical protein